MHRTFTNSRFALILRRLRGRFGISAPRVAVRPHVPWYWRALVSALLLAAILLMAGWVFDTGRRFAGYDSYVAKQDVDDLRERVVSLQHEADSLRRISNASESRLQIERTAQQQLSEQVRRLEAEKEHLKEDLAAFENLVLGDVRSTSIGIHRLQVEPGSSAGGTYRYRLLLAASSLRPDRDFKGHLQLVVTLQHDDKTAILLIPGPGATDAAKYLVNFKHFRRIEGEFALPEGAVMKKFEIRLMQGDTLIASQQAPI